MCVKHLNAFMGWGASVVLSNHSSNIATSLIGLQVIIEEAYAEGRYADHIKGALTLFVDFVAIFVRLLVILANKAESREEDDSNRSRRRKGAYQRR
jgi:hypothetical protein